MAKEISIYEPINADRDAGNRIAEQMIREAVSGNARSAARSLGKVRNLNIAYVNIEALESHVWLYPIFSGNYHFEEVEHMIQIDGVTGKLFIEVPKSVKKKRFLKFAKIAGIVLAAIATLSLLVGGINQTFFSRKIQSTPVNQSMSESSIEHSDSSPSSKETSRSQALPLSALGGAWEGSTGDFVITFELGNDCEIRKKCGTFSIPEFSLSGDVFIMSVDDGVYEFRTMNLSNGETSQASWEYLQLRWDGKLNYHSEGPYGVSDAILEKK